MRRRFCETNSSFNLSRASSRLPARMTSPFHVAQRLGKALGQILEVAQGIPDGWGLDGSRQGSQAVEDGITGAHHCTSPFFHISRKERFARAGRRPIPDRIEPARSERRASPGKWTRKKRSHIGQEGKAARTGEHPSGEAFDLTLVPGHHALVYLVLAQFQQHARQIDPGRAHVETGPHRELAWGRASCVRRSPRKRRQHGADGPAVRARIRRGRPLRDNTGQTFRQAPQRMHWSTSS